MADTGEKIISMAPAVITTGVVAHVTKGVLGKKRTRRKAKRGDYYCRKCKRVHRYGSHIYREHQCYRRPR